MPARDFALEQLDRKRLPHWPPHLLKKTRGKGCPPADSRDRALAEQIDIGVVKNLLLLQRLIAHYSGRSLKSIDPLVQKILAIGLYQLRFLTRIPASAAVNEAVEQTRRFGQGRAAAFVNAILRKATREPNPPLPDRASDPVGYAEIVLSHPRELFGQLAAILGEDDAIRFCERDNREPPTIVRLFSGRSEADLRASGVEVRPHEQPRLFIVAPRIAVLAQWAEAGIAQVQDPTAAAVVPQLQVEPGQSILDRCCGLGTKTLQIRDILGPTGWILAVDPSEERTRILRGLLERRQIANVMVRQVGMLADLHEPDIANGFDRILVDVPCSNSGVLPRRPEATYAQTASVLNSLRKLQDRILDDTAASLQAGGRMIYSTCSIWPEENEGRVAAFLSRRADYRLLDQKTTLPSLDPEPERYRDGGYLAVLERTG